MTAQEEDDSLHVERTDSARAGKRKASLGCRKEGSPREGEKENVPEPAPVSARRQPKKAKPNETTPAKQQQESPLKSPGLLAFSALPDWCDRPLLLKETLPQDERVDRYCYLAGLPLVAVAAEGKARLVEAILRQSQEVVDLQDNNGCTALHFAAKNGRTEIVDLLLRAGARQARNLAGKTPLDLALEEQHAGIISLLQQHGGKS